MFESFYSLSVSTPLTLLMLALATVLLVLYFHRRAGSSYGFVHRMYALVMGGGDFHNEDIDKFWKERKDIERFNALFNVGAKSVKEITNFQSWVERYSFDVRLLTNLRNKIDLKKMKMAKLKKRVTFFLGSILLCFVVVFISFTSIASSSSALLKFKGDDQWLWLNHEEAYNTVLYNLFNGSKWVITKESCRVSEEGLDGLASESGLSEETVGVICKSFFDKEESLEVNGIIKQQKSLYVLSVFSFVLMFIPFLELMAISRLADARRHVRNNYLCYRKEKLSV